MRIFLGIFLIFTLMELRGTYDYYDERDVRFFYTYGRRLGSMDNYQRQRRLMNTYGQNALLKDKYHDGSSTIPELHFGDFVGRNFPGNTYNRGSCHCGKANIEGRPPAKNGDEVEPPYKYPWMVAFKKKDNPDVFCGGALITDTYVLTAAHCIDRKPQESHQNKDIKLEIWQPGEIRVFFVTETEGLQPGPSIEKLIPHKDFDFKNVDHDIALVKLSRPVPCTKFTRPICLVPHGIPVSVGKVFTVAGWGVDEIGKKEGSGVLLEAQIQHVPFSRCEKKFHRRMKENYYCLKGLEGQSPCHGDSGGPMFKEYQGTYYALGVTSMHSSQKCNPNDAFLFTSVSTHIPWINSVLSNTSSSGRQRASSKRRKYIFSRGYKLSNVNSASQRRRICSYPKRRCFKNV